MKASLLESFCMQQRPSQNIIMPNISVKVLIDKEKKRVVFAEAGRDFIDVLFSFLTLPLAKIVRLFDKQSGLGLFDSFYESVEQLDIEHLQTKACKEMLLNPRSAAELILGDLKIKFVNDADPFGIYLCSQSSCLVKSTCYYTRGTRGLCCHCGKLMDNYWSLREGTGEMRGGFLMDIVDFIITDNLRVMPNSLMRSCSLLEELRIEDPSSLEERLIDFGTDEALQLLRRSLVSKNALTDIVFPDATIEPCVKYSSMVEKMDGSKAEKISAVIKEEIDVREAEDKVFNVNIISNKKNSNVLYAEVDGDFADQLLSFLTFPLGSVFRLLGNRSALEGCIGNLYSSVESMDLGFFKSEIYKNMLVSPELASCYGITKQMLKMDEMKSNNWTHWGSCVDCWKNNLWRCRRKCSRGRRVKETELIEQNPKLKNGSSDSGGTFTTDSRRFRFADNLHIFPVSSISAITGMNLFISNLTEKEVSLDKAKVLMLLSAMLVSKTALNDVFCPKPKKWRSDLL